jgi:hypothetical protein
MALLFHVIFSDDGCLIIEIPDKILHRHCHSHPHSYPKCPLIKGGTSYSIMVAPLTQRLSSFPSFPSMIQDGISRMGDRCGLCRSSCVCCERSPPFGFWRQQRRPGILQRWSLYKIINKSSYIMFR